MKNVNLSFVFGLIAIGFFFSCKSDSKEKQPENPSTEVVENQFKTFHGEFIDVDTAAVLNGKNFIYGVKMNEHARNLIKQADSLKADEYDVVNIVVTGKLEPNTQEGWDEILTINSIEKVYKPKPKKQEKVIKYSSKQNE